MRPDTLTQRHLVAEMKLYQRSSSGQELPSAFTTIALTTCWVSWGTWAASLKSSWCFLQVWLLTSYLTVTRPIFYIGLTKYNWKIRQTKLLVHPMIKVISKWVDKRLLWIQVTRRPFNIYNNHFSEVRQWVRKLIESHQILLSHQMAFKVMTFQRMI